MCLLMIYTELVVTENESMHPNIEFTYQIKVCYCLKAMKKVNKQCLSDTPRTVRVSEKTWQVIVQTSRP